MVCGYLKRKVFSNWVSLSLLSVLITSSLPLKLLASSVPCILVREEDKQRARAAKIVAGATLLALVGGVAFIALGSDCHKRRHHCRRHSHNYSSYSSYGFRNTLTNYDLDVTQLVRQKVLPRSLSPDALNESSLASSRSYEKRGCSLSKNQAIAQESSELSGAFAIHPGLHSLNQGSASVYVKLPDGTTRTLGNAPFSGTTFISYGPYTQKGTYHFGVCVEECEKLSSRAKVCTLDICVKGMAVANHDFFAPAHCQSHCELQPFEFTLE